MVEIRFDKLSQEDCKKLASLNIETRKGTRVQINRGLKDTTKSIDESLPYIENTLCPFK